MRLDPRQWERVQRLFHASLEFPETDRDAFLSRECAGNASLEDAVRALLAADEGRTSVLDRDLASVAKEVLDGTVMPYRSVGPYRLTKVLGRGGMGVVYLGEREDTGGKAAVKILRDAALSQVRRQRFSGEQRALASLDHPSIARLYDADVLPDGTPYFVMEYVEGVPLTDFCESGNRTLLQRMQVFRGVCEAVQAAHRQAIVHRDLKPSNILVKADGTLKLLDFGIAKQLDGPENPADPTQTAFRVMTPAYAAPEQVRGEPIGIYTDIYALGVLLYELLTGRQPLDLSDLTPGEAERRITQDQPERPSQAGRRPPGGPYVTATRGQWADLDVMCMTAMHKDPHRRYRTVQGLIRDLDNFFRGDPLDAQPDSWTYRARKFMRRNTRAVVAATAVATVGLFLAMYSTVRIASARDTARAEAERAERIQSFMLGLFSGGDQSVGPADTLRVTTLLDRGVREARALDAEPSVQAELLATLGGLYQQLGSLDRADSLLQLALERRRAESRVGAADLARSILALGSLRIVQARLEDAEDLVEEGLSLAVANLPPDHPVVLEGQTALGRVYQETGKYDEALSLLKGVVTRRAAVSPESPELSQAMGELANTFFYAGDYESADSLNRLTLELDRRIFGPIHPNVADGLINLGAVQFQWGRYAEAERLYREALDIIQPYFGPDHPETASALTMLGRALNYEGKTEEALGHLQRALSIEVGVFGPIHPTVASTENDIGLIALVSGDLPLAEESFQRMAETYDSVFPEPHWLKGIARSNLAAVYLETRNYTGAERYFREAKDIFEETLSPDDMNTGIARIKLGRALLGQERWSEAEAESLAGYEILQGKTDPSVSWLQSARQDLAAEYEALGRPSEAERFRAEADRYEKPLAGSS